MTLDKAEKIVMIDESRPVQVIIDAIGLKFDVMHPEEYSLIKIDTSKRFFLCNKHASNNNFSKQIPG